MSLRVAKEGKKAYEIAQRAYARALRAKTCNVATTNLRLGQTWWWRGRDAADAVGVRKTEYKYMSPIQRELFTLERVVPVAEMNAHIHRLELCGITMLQHEYAVASDRLREKYGPEKSIERRTRKRPKKRS